MEPRFIDRKNVEILYQYCSPETFINIIQNKTLRFSDIFAMNDFTETHWGEKILNDAVDRLGDKIPDELASYLRQVFPELRENLLPTVCCFSRDGDVLSQWRAYGHDGSGYAIGFAIDEMHSVPARPLEILYETDDQIREAEEYVKHLAAPPDLSIFSFDEDCKKKIRTFASDLCAFKNPGFREELEIRLVHMLLVDRTQNQRKLRSVGGYSKDKEIEGSEIKFRNSNSTPVAFVDLKFDLDPTEKPIKKLYLGPRNKSSISSIQNFLGTNGVHNVEIRKSETSYG
ncbi:hypothetical protein CRT23_10635 [Methylobacterium sp. V23]|nr:hypothetical protein CRT23_10635 [Methylobacterium sp. V23]